MVEVARDLGRAVVGSGRAEVGHGHPEGESAGEFHVERNPHGLHHGRVDHEGHGAGVVHRRVVEALLVFVGVTEELEQFAHESRRRGVDGRDRRGDLGRRERLMRQVEADHGERPRLVEDDVRGLRVDHDVELARRRPVADVDPAAHQHHLLDPGCDARLFAHGQRDVGEGPRRYQGDLAGFGRHDRVDDEVHRVPGIERQRGLGQHGTIEP